MQSMWQWIHQYWRTPTVIAAAFVATWWVCVAWGEIQTDEHRLDVVEATHPEATAALVRRQTDDISEIRKNTTDTDRVVWMIAGRLGIQPRQ
jgi:glycerate-2-kinase